MRSVRSRFGKIGVSCLPLLLAACATNPVNTPAATPAGKPVAGIEATPGTIAPIPGVSVVTTPVGPLTAPALSVPSKPTVAAAAAGAGVQLADSPGAELPDVPAPPNATHTGGGRLSAQGQGTIESKTYTTSDPPEQVVGFYRERLKRDGWQEASFSSLPSEVVVVLSHVEKRASVSITAIRRNEQTEVAVVRTQS
ncbi:MAG: hypothetical protein HY329_15200 [Chloroflexi bacterium]|nr:hypothetical protein [Chloroflexota bacterium]